MPRIFNFMSLPAAHMNDRGERAGLIDGLQSSDYVPASQRKDEELLEKMWQEQAAFKTKSSTLPKPHNINDDDWESQALKGIEKKKLTLDRGWNGVTWTQKSTCLERLKLLKDDGVDISSLKGAKLNSPDITRAVLEQVNSRKRRSGSQGELLPSAADDHMDTSGAEERPKDVAVSPIPDLAILHDNNRPLSPLLIRRKRARDDTPEVKVSWESHGTTEPRRKKVCRTELRNKQHAEEMKQEELIMDWGVLKQQVLNGIFKADPTTTEDKSRITINFPSQSAKVTVSGSLKLNSKGYDKIMEELRLLSDGPDEDGSFELRGEHSDICVITNVSLRTIIEGPFQAVINLCGRLTQPGKGVAHMAKRHFNDAGVRQAEGIVYELSTKTQGELKQIGEALTAGRDVGNAEVQVRWVWDSVKAVPWPDRLY